jgi:peroxiredoxin
MLRSIAVFVLALATLVVAAPVSSADDPVKALALLKTATAQTAKDFEVPTPDDRKLRLAEFKGKVVLLNFWATWCKPCEEEMPGMERLYKKYRERGLVVLAVAADAEGASIVSPFIKKHGLTFPVGLDPRMSLSSQYGVWALPSTFIIDRAGRRALTANGPREWDGRAAESLFESLLR